MNLKAILSQIDSEIASLQQARALLTGKSVAKKRGRPAKRKMSAASRAKIAEAQRKRWAKQRKAAE